VSRLTIFFMALNSFCKASTMASLCSTAVFVASV
jgi:hypothetical protein